MTPTFKYNLDTFKVYSTAQAQNIVKSVRFELVCELNGKQKTAFQTIVFQEPDFNKFIPFESLTQDQVMAWVSEKIGAQEIEALKNGLVGVLEQEAARAAGQPSIQTVNAPWA